MAKNTARDEADRISRMYAQIIKNQPSHLVSRDLKVAAGVPVLDRGARRRNGPPGTFPYLEVNCEGVPGLGSNLKIRFRDSALGTFRMPRVDGVTHLVLHAKVLAAPRQIVAHATRNPFRVRFDADLLARFGLVATRTDDPTTEFRAVNVAFRGQWLNAKAEVGPLGPPSMLVVPVSCRQVHAIEERDSPPLSLSLAA